jgi:rhodanese-related sulfurtransferase
MLDKDKTYLIYDQSGDYSADALDMLVELDFSEIYNMLGGITQWKAQELPTVQGQEIVTQILEKVSVQEAFALIQENQNNPDFVIIDLRPPEEFAEGHIEDAINIYYESETFRDELDQLDKDKAYLIYWSCACGRRSDKAQDMMAELNFKAVYNMRSGSDVWTAEGYPLVE